MTTYTVLGPFGYSRPPYGDFSGRSPQVSSTPKGGWIGRRPPTKRWWEELQEEYQERYASENPSPSKKAVAVREEIQEIVEEAVTSGLLDELNAPKVAELVVKAQYAPRLDLTLEYARQLKEYIDRLYEEDEDDIMILTLALQ